MKGAKCSVLMGTVFLVALLTAFPAYGEADKDWHVTAGLNLGGYALEIEDMKTDTGIGVSPMIDFWYKKYGLGLSSLWANVSYDGAGFNEKIDRLNWDFSLKYRINPYITALTGVRWESNSYDSDIPGFNFDYKVQIYPVLGAAFSYPFSCGATPFLVASYFPYAKLTFDVAGLDDQTGHGFAGSAGVAYTFSIPVTVSLGFKYQRLALDFDEDTLFYYGGAFYTF